MERSDITTLERTAISETKFVGTLLTNFIRFQRFVIKKALLTRFFSLKLPNMA